MLAGSRVATMKAIACLPAALFLTLFAAAGAADDSPPPAGPAGAGTRPRVCLVLSGGGARGLAHVGVLKVLESLRVPVDCVAGTSMGAVVGGLYASGMSAEEIETLVRTLDWRSSFDDRSPRQDLDYRRKQEERQFLVRLPVGFDREGFRLPRGLVQGQKLTQVLREKTLPVAAVEDFDRLPIPFRAVATDIESGEAVVLAHGDLTEAMRASMSAPGVFAPVEAGDRLLVDGGLVNNLPVDVVRSMGADIVIAVDVGFRPQPREELDSAIALSNQMIAVMLQRETARQRALLRPGDVLIQPPLGTLSSIEFDRVGQFLRKGEEAARLASASLRVLAAPQPDWQDYLARRRALRDAPAPRVDFVRAGPASQRHAASVEAAMGSLVGRPLDTREVERGIRRLYGDGTFEVVDYRLRREHGSTGLEVSARPKSWGPNYVRFGLELQDDFEGGNNFNAGLRALFTDLNALGGEFQLDLQVGEEPTVFAELYQPLGPASPWFIAPRVSTDRRSFDVISGDFRLAEYRVRTGELGLDFGRELGNWGEVRTGFLRASGSSQLRVGDPFGELPRRTDFERGELYARFGLDRLDSAYFPGHGELFTLEWYSGRESLGADFDSDRVTLDWLLARSRGRDTGVLWLTGGSNISAPADAVQDFFTLGGLFNLSGRVAESLAGPQFAIARGIYYRRIGRGGPGFLNVPTYAGLSLEIGNVWDRRSDIDFDSARVNGAGFVGLDTPLGPVYFAVGFDEGGGNSFYLLLGRIR
jgi:NTE family protein